MCLVKVFVFSASVKYFNSSSSGQETLGNSPITLRDITSGKYAATIIKPIWDVSTDGKRLLIYIYICLLYFAGTELNNQIARAVFITESTKIK